jgi:hypothetical protein
VNDQLLFDDFVTHGDLTDTGTIALTANKPVSVITDYFQGAGGADVQFSWSSPSQKMEIVPSTQLIPTSGVPDSCASGECCAAGGPQPLCCPSGSRCLVGSAFTGCCPEDSDCQIHPMCGPTG